MLAAAVIAVAACGGGTVAGPTSNLPGPPGSSPGVSITPSISPPATEATAMPTTGSFTLTSTAFADDAPIPGEYTCQGADLSPALEWSGLPEGTAALLLVVDDPDADDFTHWIVLDLAPSETGLQKGVAPAADPPQQGRNDFGRAGWSGPCPPSGTHHYRFTLTALAARLQLDAHPSRPAIDAALAGATVLGTAVLTGLYRRS